MLDLLKTNKATVASTTDGGAKAVNGASVMVPLRKIADNPYQPRGHYDAEHILNLAMSIKGLKEELPATKGLQQIPMARIGTMDAAGEFDIAAKHMYGSGEALGLLYAGQGVAQLMFGHSRLRAFMVLAEGIKALRNGGTIGMDFAAVSELESRYDVLMEADPDYAEMPIAVGFALDHQMWAHAITENSQRKNITAIEEAQSIQRAIDEFGLTAEEAGKPFGYARSTTANKMRLLQLPTDARAAIADGRLTERHGRELLRLARDPERMRQALEQALKKSWTVRQLTDDVDWRERALLDVEARASEFNAARRALAAGWTLPGQSALVPADRLEEDTIYSSNFERDDEDERRLIEEGHCGPHCACFRMKYMQWRAEGGYQIDPEHAPHIVATCNDSVHRRTKLQALPLPDATTPAQVAERAERERQRLEAERLNNEAHAIWQRWLRDVDLRSMWGDIRFWREAVNYNWLAQEILNKCEGPHDATQELLRMFYKRTRRYSADLNTEVHAPDDTVALITRLGGSVSRETEGSANE